ncbi:zinc-ribbon like family domain-containing protein [Ditylenchus destructor]|uniref:Zinc-ribbon like family domain-containing protein n=1 Tax=Ditylenchus destructor TaxID=166010 RepID=A0AAD4NGL8_9BILA|nr:zinc-ribbon like family domain-containing protein [Ditylenchus destructor]
MVPEIVWLNGQNKRRLFTLDTEAFCLYKVNNRVGRSESLDTISLSYSCPLNVVGTKQDHDSLRCFALDYTSENLLALGFSNGRINITKADVDSAAKFSRGEDIRDTRDKAAQRNISCLAWHPGDNTRLSVSSSRCLRFTDLRERSGFQTTVNVASPQFGITSEPTVGYLFACHSRSTVSVFDRRLLTFPIHEIRVGLDTQIINKLTWRRNRPFHITCVNKDSANLICLPISPKSANYLEKNGLNSEAVRQNIEIVAREFSYVPLYYSTPDCNKVVSFDWHPQGIDRIALLVGSTTQQSPTKNIQIVQISHSADSSISANGDIAFSHSNSLNIAEKVSPMESGRLSAKHNFAELSSYFDQPDLAIIMKKRIKRGYGYAIIESSRKAIDEDPYANDDLKFCWRFPGITHIIKAGKEKSIPSIKSDDVTYRNRIFTNDRRDTILKICGWPPFDDRTACKLMFDELMQRGTVQSQSRAAALAMFAVQGANCKQYLHRLCEFTQSAEFIDNNDPDFTDKWRKMAHVVKEVMDKFDGIKVPDYEQVSIIRFLARREGYNITYTAIISLEGIELEDKLAFAAIHMDDDMLKDMALNRLLRELEIEGRPLSALLITGLDDNRECHDMIQRYIDVTRDIQTASILLVIGNCFHGSRFPQNTLGDKISTVLTKAIEAEPYEWRRKNLHCVRDYFELMNNWCFWLPRTFLSSFLRIKNPAAENSGKSISPQAVIACYYCGVPVYPTIMEKVDNLRSSAGNTVLNLPRRGEKTRIMSCPKCRKPLAKCAICRYHFGSHADSFSSTKNSAIDHWFVWCCHCNHGGHLSHIRDWFQEYKICPVSGCDCHCMERDYRFPEYTGSTNELQQNR